MSIFDNVLSIFRWHSECLSIKFEICTVSRLHSCSNKLQTYLNENQRSMILRDNILTWQWLHNDKIIEIYPRKINISHLRFAGCCKYIKVWSHLKFLKSKNWNVLFFCCFFFSLQTVAFDHNLFHKVQLFHYICKPRQSFLKQPDSKIMKIDVWRHFNFAENIFAQQTAFFDHSLFF